MITAKEAREIYEKALESKLKGYEDEIREAANACEKSIEISGYLNDTVKGELKGAGYTVSESDSSFGKPKITYVCW